MLRAMMEVMTEIRAAAAAAAAAIRARHHLPDDSARIKPPPSPAAPPPLRETSALQGGGAKGVEQHVSQPHGKEVVVQAAGNSTSRAAVPTMLRCRLGRRHSSGSGTPPCCVRLRCSGCVQNRIWRCCLMPRGGRTHSCCRPCSPGHTPASLSRVGHFVSLLFLAAPCCGRWYSVEVVADSAR